MKQLGLVFGGGGARGAYEVGVWQAMEELGIQAQIVCGTSIGALNGALYAQGSFEQAMDIWYHMNPERVIANGVNVDFDLDFMMSQKNQLEKFIQQFVQQKSVDISPLKQLIAEYLNEERVRNSPISFGLCTVELPKNRPLLLPIDQIPQGQLKDFLLASASCFPVFPLCQIGDKFYIDGGYYDNVPIQLAHQMGATEFIVVDLKSRMSLEPKYRSYRNVTFISPYYDLSSFLNFDGQTARNNIRLGYLDAMKRFHRYVGFVYTFEVQGISMKHPYLMRFLHMKQKLEKRFAKHPRFRSYFQRILSARTRNSILMDEFLEDFGLALRCCEVTGEVFGLDRMLIYQIDVFHSHLKTKFLEKKKQFVVSDLLQKDVRDIIRLLEPTTMVVFLFHRLEELLKQDQKLEEFLFMLSLKSDEVLAAIYLFSMFY